MYVFRWKRIMSKDNKAIFYTMTIKTYSHQIKILCLVLFVNGSCLFVREKKLYLENRIKRKTKHRKRQALKNNVGKQHSLSSSGIYLCTYVVIENTISSVPIFYPFM